MKRGTILFLSTIDTRSGGGRRAEGRHLSIFDDLQFVLFRFERLKRQLIRRRRRNFFQLFDRSMFVELRIEHRRAFEMETIQLKFVVMEMEEFLEISKSIGQNGSAVDRQHLRRRNLNIQIFQRRVEKWTRRDQRGRNARQWTGERNANALRFVQEEVE